MGGEDAEHENGGGAVNVARGLEAAEQARDTIAAHPV